MKDVTIKFKGVQAGDFKLDASEITVPDDAASAAEALVQNVYDAIEAIDKVQGELEAMTGERDTLQKELEGAENISPERLDEMSEQRRVIMDVAEHVGFKREDLKPVGNAEIIEQVVRKDDAGTPEDAGGEYLSGCFRQIQNRMDREALNKDKLAKLGSITRPNRTDADKGDSGAGGDGGEELSHREAAELKMQNIHGKTDEQLQAEGWRN